jgi:hypothetical protein
MSVPRTGETKAMGRPLQTSQPRLFRKITFLSTLPSSGMGPISVDMPQPTDLTDHI